MDCFASRWDSATISRVMPGLPTELRHEQRYVHQLRDIALKHFETTNRRRRLKDPIALEGIPQLIERVTNGDFKLQCQR